MSLQDYQIATRVIPIDKKNNFSVRGLAFDDVQHLLVNESGLVDQALGLFGGDIGFDINKADPQQLRAFASKLLVSLPTLVAQLIARGADEPAMADKVKRLPAPVQLDALMGVYELTFTEPGSLKKFFDRLADLMTSIPRPGKAVSPTNLDSLRAGLSASGVMLAS